MTLADQPRVQTGSGAGQYSFKQHGAPTSTLESEQSGDTQNALSPEEALRLAQSVARSLNSNPDDADDIASEAVMRYYDYLARRREKSDGTNGITVEPIHSHTALLRRIVLKERAKNISRGIRYEDSKSLDNLRSIRQQIERRSGRKLRGIEVDGLAETIRDSLPAGRRPTEQFHSKIQQAREVVSLDAPDTNHSSDAFSAEQPMIQVADDPVAVDGQELPEGTLAAALEDEIENAAPDERLQQSYALKRYAWNAVAQLGNQTYARPSIISETTATTVRKKIRQAGGPQMVAAAWQNGTLDESTRSAFFAPFGGGDIPDDQQRKVVETFTSLGDYGPDAWDGALAMSTRPRARTSKNRKDFAILESTNPEPTDVAS